MTHITPSSPTYATPQAARAGRRLAEAREWWMDWFVLPYRSVTGQTRFQLLATDPLGFTSTPGSGTLSGKENRRQTGVSAV